MSGSILSPTLRTLALVLALVAALLSTSAAANVHQDKKVNVYLIPLDDFSVDASAQLARQLSEEFGIWVKSTLPIVTRNLRPFPATDQYAAEDIFDAAQTMISRLPERSPDTTYVLLTNRDLNSRARNFRFMFSYHDRGSRVSVVSSARMRFSADGSSRSNEHILSNFTKMTKRAIGEMYFGWERSSDINDLMYSPIMSLDDLDKIGNRHPSPKSFRWKLPTT